VKQFDPATLPAFAGARQAVLEQTVAWVHSHVVRALPDEEWIRQRFLQRTVGEIISDGFTLAYMPCLERCLVTAAILGHHGIDTYFVLHDQPGGLWHFAIELRLESGAWVWADYSSRESRLFDGPYRYFEKPDSIPRFMRIMGPRRSPDIWRSRPPLRFLAGIGVSLSSRYTRFCEMRESYLEKFRSGEYQLSDHLVRDPADSVYAADWVRYGALEVGQGNGAYADLTKIHLYLEIVPSEPHGCDGGEVRSRQHGRLVNAGLAGETSGITATSDKKPDG
jgi:hypothetical protein